MGKTQFALHMCLKCAIEGEEVLFIDTDANFPAERLSNMCKDAPPSVNQPSVFKRIHVHQELSFFNLMKFLDSLQKDLRKPDGVYRNVRLIVLDSYTNPLQELIEYRVKPTHRSAYTPIRSAYNRALRSLVMYRQDLSIIASYHNRSFNYLESNNCGLVLEFDKDPENSSLQITVIQGERIERPIYSGLGPTFELDAFSLF